MQKTIPALFMRGGTSRGPFFHERDLPDEERLRDAVLLAVMGSPDPRQIDGLGGAHPLKSKAGIVRDGAAPGIDLDFRFCQVGIDKVVVNTRPNCGNMLSAVVPFALETGLKQARADTTRLRVRTLNTGMICDVTVQTPGGQLTYEGDARIAGVPGTAAPVLLDFIDTAGSVCAGLLPTGKVRDTFDVPGVGTIDATCIDNGMPMVLLDARAFGLSGHESVEELNGNNALKDKLESVRLVVGEAMGLGDVRPKPYPKMCFLAAPRAGGVIATRCFIPHVCHTSLGVLQAVTVASACVFEGSVAAQWAAVPAGQIKQMDIEHPSGSVRVELETSAKDPQHIVRTRILRTARLLMRGEVMVPMRVWEGRAP